MDNFIYRLGSPNSRLGRPPQFYRSSDLINGGCQFASVYAVRAEDAKAIEEAGTAAGFKGIVWSQKLWVDFDEEAAATAAQVKLKLEGIEHVVFTTGGRGCHIGITRVAKPSHLLPLQDKEWVEKTLPGADLSLYWHLHLIRLPGATHERTGQPKRLLYSHGGRSITLPPFNPDGKHTESSSDSVEVTESRESLFQNWNVMNKLTPNGSEDRHSQLVRLAAALKDHGGVVPLEMTWLLVELNKQFSEPKSRNEIDRVVQWAYSK